jgi:hypothetical protein
MIIHNPILTGSFTVNGTDVASITSSAANLTALNAITASILSTTGSLNTASGSAITRLSSIETVTGSNITRLNSIETVTGSNITRLSSLEAKTGSYATTGSNTFVDTQTISGSILQSGSFTSTGTLTAQTLVVQTITSSVDFVTGSTRFGSLAANTHIFTGSIYQSGSVASFAGAVGIGVVSPGVALDVSGYGKFTGIGLNSTPSSIGTNPNYVRLTNTGGDLYLGQEGSTSGTFFNGSLAYDSVLYSGRSYNFIINGVSRMYISSSGNIGIGNTNPGAKLEIESARNSTILRLTAISGENWEFKNTNTVGSTDVLSIGANGATINLGLKDDGSVGIGTTSPSYTLDVNGTGRFNSSLYVNSPIYFQNGGTSYFQMYAGSGGDLVVYNTTTNGFSVYTNSSQRFFISGSGNIGIATGTPSAKLDIYAGADATSNLVLWGQTIRNEGNGAATGYGTGLKLKISSDGEPYKWAGIAAVAGTGYSNRTDLGLFTAATSTSDATEKVRITGDGNVGIGTSNPLSKLHISGSGANTQTLNLQSSANNANAYAVFSSGNKSYITGLSGDISNSYIIYDNTAGVERMRITSGGTVFNKQYVGSTLTGGYSLIGTISAVNVADTYAHVKISTVGSMMYWIKVFGYQYIYGLIEGMSGGYIGGGTGAVQQPYQNGSIVAQYQNNGYLEIVIYSLSTATTNRWGSITLFGGSDTITTVQPLEILDYSWTSTTTRVY